MMLDTLWQDVRYGARGLRRKPAFTAVVVATLAVGIGANTAVFSVVNAVLLRPLPYEDPERLVMGWEANPDQRVDQYLVSAPNFLDWKEQQGTLARIGAFRPSLSYNLTGSDQPVRISVALVSADVFPVLGVKPLLGRAFLPEEDQPGRHHVAVISHRLWRSHFGGDPAIIGKKLTLHENTRTVVGVMPADFQFPFQSTEQTDAWIPLALQVRDVDRDRGYHYLQVIGRLRPDGSLGQAQAEMAAIAGRLERQYPVTNAGWTVRLIPLHAQLFGNLPLALLLLEVVVGFVLLIACVNVANLLLARGEDRQKEIAIRLAVGASRGRIIRQLVTEGVLLALLGGALGLAFVYWGTGPLIAVLPDGLPRVEQVAIDGRVIAATLALALATTLIFALLPAWLAANPRRDALKEGGRTSGAATGRHRLRGSLAVCQVALGLVLLVGATLMIKSFLRLQRVELGFDSSNLLTMELYLPNYKYPEPQLRTAFYREILLRTESLPGVRSAALVTSLPIGGRYNWIHPFSVEGRPTSSSADQPVSQWRAVTSDYFRAMAIPLRAGRHFSDTDQDGAGEVAIINEATANRYFQNEDPIGKRLSIAGKPWRTIVGVVGNVRDQVAAEAKPEVYVPYLQSPENYSTVVVRTDRTTRGLASAVRSQILAVDGDQPVFNVRTMEEVVSESVAQPRFQAFLLGIFAGVALLLAAVGVYGVISYSVSRRTHEIGIRMALGASRRDVLSQVIRQGLWLILVGLGLGVALSLALTRFLSSLLFGVSATDLGTFATVALVLAGVGLLACVVPARRAARVEPMQALRSE